MLAVHIKRTDRERCMVNYTTFLTARTHEVEHIIITELGEHSVLMEPQSWAEIFDLPTLIRPDAQFLCDHAECESWSAGRESLRMECSYRHMRKKYFVLMAGLIWLAVSGISTAMTENHPRPVLSPRRRSQSPRCFKQRPAAVT
jgi:deoxyribodipyrimidine photolyase-like uncharacterized protein